MGMNDMETDDSAEDFDDEVCDRCHGDGMDPWCD